MKQERPNNLLVSLHKWADRQDENFTTDAFAYLLRYLVRYDTRAAVSVLRKLTGDLLRLDEADCNAIEIATQDTVAEGILDIKISAPDCLVVIEAKVGSEPSSEQLLRYKAYLERSKLRKIGLVLLTRYPVEEGLTEKLLVPRRWYQVAMWFEQELRSSGRPLEGVSTFLIGQFLEFLRARRMTMEQVNWQLVEGIRSLTTLLDMLREAILSSRGKVTKFAGWAEGTGYTFRVNEAVFWVGVRFREPQDIVFEAYDLDEAAAKRIGMGDTKRQDEGYRWRHRLNLASEEVHFFTMPTAGQMQCLVKFVSECIRKVSQLTA